MKKRYGLLIVAALAGLAGANAQELGSFKVGNWQGGAFTNDDTKAFSHCAAVATYKNGLNLIVSVTQEGEWLLGLSKDGAGMTVGEQGTAEVAFDGRAPLSARYEVRKPTLLAIGMPFNSAVMNSFRASRKMDINLTGSHFFFNLDETWRLMPILSDCLRNKSVPQTAALTSAPPPAATPATPSAARSDDVLADLRNKFLAQGFVEYKKCRSAQIAALAPKSEDSAEDVALAVRERCGDTERMLVSLGDALFGTAQGTMQDAVSAGLSSDKSNLSSDIARFREEAVNKPAR